MKETSDTLEEFLCPGCCIMFIEVICLGRKDTATAVYMRQNEIFADAFNYFIYGGEQVIAPECLEEMDTREVEVPYGGPLSIHEMFAVQDAEMLTLVPDYRLNLIAPADIQDEDFEKFHSTLREILSFIKYSEDADKLAEIVENNERFRHLNKTERDVLNACTDAELTMEEEKEECNVCLAI